MPQSFARQVEALVKGAERDVRAISVAAIQDVVEAAQTPQLGITRGAADFEVGKIPVADSDLVNSLVTRVAGGDTSPGPESYSVGLAGWQPGEALVFSWTMSYAARIEFGFRGTDELGRSYEQEGRFFVGANAARFPEFVKRRARERRAMRRRR